MMVKKNLLFVLCVSSTTGISVSAAADETPYGSCSHRAEVYQRRYEASSQSSDLVCYQKALLRELRSSQKFDCPRSAQHYQTAYEKGTDPATWFATTSR